MIYTANFGGKDHTRDDIKCFTEPSLFLDPNRDAKKFKVLSHIYLDCEYSVWVDGNIFPTIDLEKAISLLDGADVAAFRHSSRKTVWQELSACRTYGKDCRDTMEKHIERYRKEGFIHDNGLSTCGVLIRKHTEKVMQMNNAWWAEICTGSKRDQLSFMYVVKKHNINFKFLDGDYRKNPYFIIKKHRKPNT